MPQTHAEIVAAFAVEKYDIPTDLPSISEEIELPEPDLVNSTSPFLARALASAQSKGDKDHFAFAKVVEHELEDEYALVRFVTTRTAPKFCE